jgi:hypothetical protein
MTVEVIAIDGVVEVRLAVVAGTGEEFFALIKVCTKAGVFFCLCWL